MVSVHPIVLANAHAAAIVAARADQPFASVDGLWRRAGVPSAALVQLAVADALRPAMGLAAADVEKCLHSRRKA